MDAREAIKLKKWDFMIAHPVCTFLAVSGNKWMKPEYKDRFPTREQDRKDAVDFFMEMVNADIPHIAVENPISVMSTIYRKPDQIIHPWQFGHPLKKSTCLWLKDLPLLVPTNIVEKGEDVTTKSGKKISKWYYEALFLPKEERQRLRSKTFTGIAEAMAQQYSEYIIKIKFGKVQDEKRGWRNN